MTTTRRAVNLLSPLDVVDITMKFEDRTMFGFAINYRANIKDNWHEVYRVDTEHGYLHEQRYWISPEPRPIKYLEGLPIKVVFKQCWKDLKENWENYRKNMEEKLRKE